MAKFVAIYFSATDTTRRSVAAFCRGFGSQPIVEINLADNLNVAFPNMAPDDVAVVASPVYGGRLPVQVAEALARLKGNGATAAAMVVYGNRDFDDALLELTDLLGAAGFRIAGAGAFIGCHSIFPKVATSRPDASDEQTLADFGDACRQTITSGFNADNVPFIKGNRPYKKAAGVALHPSAKAADCTQCGKCAARCPMGAIDKATPFATDAAKCISCGRCIAGCPKGARRYSGLSYSLIGFIFKAAFSKPKSPTWLTSKP